MPADQYSRLAAAQAAWRNPPLISILLPTYNTRREDLVAVLASVQAQIYTRWELCVADDASTEPQELQLRGPVAPMIRSGS